MRRVCAGRSHAEQPGDAPAVESLQHALEAMRAEAVACREERDRARAAAAAAAADAEEAKAHAR